MEKKEAIKQKLCEEPDIKMEMDIQDCSDVKPDLKIEFIKTECHSSTNNITEITTNVHKHSDQFTSVNIKNEIDYIKQEQVDTKEFHLGNNMTETVCNSEHDYNRLDSFVSANIKYEVDQIQEEQISIKDEELDDAEMQNDKLCSELSSVNNETSGVAKRRNYQNKSKNKSNRKPLNCPECSYIAYHRGNLNRHLRLHKSDVPKFYCDHCPYSSIDKSNLARHSVIHQDEKPYQCTICEERFKRNDQIRIHMNKVHPQQCEDKMKVFQCEQCPYKTFWSGHFKNHKVQHGFVEDRPKYQCAYCEHSSYHKSDMKRHVLRHEGVKRFSCDMCQYSCSSAWNLRRHKGKVHKIKKEKE